MIVESPLMAENAFVREVVDAGDYYIGVVKQGETLRILDLEGNQAADTLFFNAHNPSERYSAMDTIREQGKVYLTTGSQLRSNENNVMLEIVADTCGRHDTSAGHARRRVIRFVMTWKNAACMPVEIAGC